MSTFPATTVKVVSIEPAGDTKVRIMMELCVDVHRLADVSGDLLHAAVSRIKEERASPKRKKLPLP